MDKDLAEQVVDVASRVVASGAISANGHGNVSIRVPGSDEMYFTAGPSLRNHPLSATAYAEAQRPIGCWVEALAMFGLPTGVPVAGYGPRGSEEAVANIRGAVLPGVPAVLLSNHGVLVFYRTPELAIVVGGIVEEAAQAGINAGSLGGPVEIPDQLRAAALQRAMAFDSAGTAHA